MLYLRAEKSNILLVSGLFFLPVLVGAALSGPASYRLREIAVIREVEKRSVEREGRGPSFLP